jgi:uncharacterized protein YndB with AHSA1/START domain
MTESDYCAVRLTRTYPAAPAVVWAVLTEPESLGRWLARAGEIELAPGGSFEVGRVEARVREVDPERMLELDWSQPGEEASIVRFELVPDGGGTRLVLDHSRVHEPVGMSYIARWTGTLARLESELRSRP